MKITIINQFYPPDIAPTGKLAASLAYQRASLKDQVTIVAGSGAYTPEDRSEHSKPYPGIAIHLLWTPNLGKSHKLTRIFDYAVFYLLAAIRLISLPRQDVIISLTTPPFIAWVAILHKWIHPGTRVVLWNMDCYPEIAERTGVIHEGGWLSRVLRALNRQLFRRIDRVICLDHAMRQLLQSHYAPKEARPFVSRHPELGAGCAISCRSKVPSLGDCSRSRR